MNNNDDEIKLSWIGRVVPGFAVFGARRSDGRLSTIYQSKDGLSYTWRGYALVDGEVVETVGDTYSSYQQAASMFDRWHPPYDGERRTPAHMVK